MAKQTPPSTPWSRKLRGISDGVSEAARKSAPIISPRPEKDRHSEASPPPIRRTGPRGAELRAIAIGETPAIPPKGVVGTGAAIKRLRERQVDLPLLSTDEQAEKRSAGAEPCIVARHTTRPFPLPKRSGHARPEG